MDPISPDHYLGYDEMDFINDPRFQQWVMRPAGESENFWNRFMTTYPHKREAIGRARAFLQHLHFEEEKPDEARAKAHFRLHLQQREAPAGEGIVEIHRRVRYKWLQAVAAAAAGAVLITSALLFLNRKQPQKVQTQFGELKTMILPDSSVVVLNAHSAIKYHRQWPADKQREVWLEGEAFFNIRHLNRTPGNISAHEEFYVHTADLDITVLGTSFDVRQRRNKTEIVLQTGRIKVHVRTDSSNTVLMNPGELVQYSPGEHLFFRNATVPEDYAAWKEKKLILNNPTVHEIITYLEDNYGKKIMLQNAGMGTQVIEGPIMLNSLDDALFVLSAILNTQVVKKDGVILLVSRK